MFIDFTKWKTLRKKGFINFVLKYGILYYGLPLGLLIGFFNELINGYTPISLVFSTIAGTLYGIILGITLGTLFWVYYENKWKKLKQ